MWEDIELRQVRVFLALGEHLHFGRAADSLGLTTSRVSQSLRTLERDLGTRLLHRTSRTVVLTADGAALFTALQPAYEQLADVLKTAGTARGNLNGTLRIGLATPATGGSQLTRIIAAFEQVHRQCCVEVVELPFRDRTGPLVRGEVDVIVTRLPLDDPAVTIGPRLSSDPRVVLVKRDHPLAAHKSVTMEDIAKFLVIDGDDALGSSLGQALIPSQTPSGSPIQRLPVRVESLTQLVSLVARGSAVHLSVPGFAAALRHPDVTSRPITDLPPSLSALAWHRDCRDNRLTAFILTATSLAATAEQLTPDDHLLGL